MGNLLSYIPQIIKSSPDLPTLNNRIGNRANNMGKALEIYIKESIAGYTQEDDEQVKIVKDSGTFSWLGNKNNIPDLILKNGDALEIKKVESINSNLALNSSSPKNKLYAKDTRLAKGALNCEEGNEWQEKNLYYAIGVCPKGAGSISNLFFVDGECYAADKEIYENMANKISSAILSAEGVTFKKTNELAGIENVDPLGITTLRVRGMWHIETPYKLFSHLFKSDSDKFNIAFLARKEKFNVLDKLIQDEIKNIASVKDVDIKDPNNPSKIIKAVYISYAG